VTWAEIIRQFPVRINSNKRVFGFIYF